MANSAAQVTDIIWRQYATMLNDGSISEIVITGGIANVIGQQGIDTIAKRYRNTIQASVSIVSDVVRNVILVQPSRNQMGQSEIIPTNPAPKNVISKKEKLPRPPNAFILYRQHHHPLIKANNPTFHNNQISIILGKQWKDEDELTKANFRLMADSLKKKHFLDHPEYQYQPRKPAEKKRRMTRRKAEALAANDGGNLGASTNVASNFGASLEPKEDFITLPDFDTTLGGNVVFNMGDDDLEDETFEAMLEKYNAAVPSITNPRQGTTSATLFSEPTEEGQNNLNFYSSIEEIENYQPVVEDFNYGFDAILGEAISNVLGGDDGWHNIDPTAQGRVYDAQHTQDAGAELQRSTVGL